MTVFKMEIISQSVLTRLEYYCFFFFAQNQKCGKYFSSFTGLYFFFISYSMDANVVAD